MNHYDLDTIALLTFYALIAVAWSAVMWMVLSAVGL